MRFEYAFILTCFMCSCGKAVNFAGPEPKNIGQREPLVYEEKVNWLRETPPTDAILGVFIGPVPTQTGQRTELRLKVWMVMRGW